MIRTNKKNLEKLFFSDIIVFRPNSVCRRRIKNRMEQDKHTTVRYPVAFPVRLEWCNSNGEVVVSDGKTDNIGAVKILLHLPRTLPSVGITVNVTITEGIPTPVTVSANVIRIVRNYGYPQVGLKLVKRSKEWEAMVWEFARELLSERERDDDW